MEHLLNALIYHYLDISNFKKIQNVRRRAEESEAGRVS